MESQEKNIRQLFSHLKERMGGLPLEEKNFSDQKYRFCWITNADIYEVFQIGDCLYFCAATEKNVEVDELTLLKLLNWLNGYSYYGTFTFAKSLKKVSLEQTHFTYSEYELSVLLSFFDNMYKRMTLYYLSSDLVFKEGMEVEDAVDKARLQISSTERQ